MSYRKKHIRSKIQRIKPKKHLLKKKWVWVLIIFLALVSLMFYGLFFLPNIQIKTVTVSGNLGVKSEDLQEFVLENSGIKILDISGFELVSHSILFVDRDEIKRDILEKFPIINEISVKRKMPQTLILGVSERKPVGIYCGEITGQEEKCFLIDNNGVIFEEVPVVPEGSAIVRQVGPLAPVLTGEEVVAKNIMEYIDKIQQNLRENFEIDLREAFLTSPVRLNVTTGEGWEIFFDTHPDANIDYQLTKLNLLLSGEISRSDRNKLWYIDLRPKDKAIICDNKTCGTSR